jgi:hypothetical protein
MSTGTAKSKHKTSLTPIAQRSPVIVRAELDRYATFFLGGAADKKAFLGVVPATKIIQDEIVNGYAQKRPSFEFNPNADFYWDYSESDAVLAKIKKMSSDVKIRLVGHSLGGWQAGKITEQLNKFGVEVDLLVTLDPVGVIYFSGQTPPNPKAKTWLNVTAMPSKIEADDVVAGVGGKWLPTSNPFTKNKPTFEHQLVCHHREAGVMSVSGSPRAIDLLYRL